MSDGTALRNCDDGCRASRSGCSRELEADGIVNRRVYPTVPLRVEYSLTDYGYSLKTALEAICDWGRGPHAADRRGRSLARAHSTGNGAASAEGLRAGEGVDWMFEARLVGRKRLPLEQPHARRRASYRCRFCGTSFDY